LLLRGRAPAPALRARSEETLRPRGRLRDRLAGREALRRRRALAAQEAAGKAEAARSQGLPERGEEEALPGGLPRASEGQDGRGQAPAGADAGAARRAAVRPHGDRAARGRGGMPDPRRVRTPLRAALPGLGENPLTER